MPAHAETISIVIATNAAPRVEFGAEKLADALNAAKFETTIVRSENVSGRKLWVGRPDPAAGHEGFSFALGGQ